MSILDIIIIGFVAIGMLTGLFRGFFKELVGTVGLLIAVLVANWVAPMGKSYALAFVSDATAAMVLAWILVFVAMMMAMSGLAYLLGKLMKAINLGWLNRMAGGLFAGLKFFIIAAILVFVVSLLCDKFDDFVLKPYWEESVLVPYILDIVDKVWKMF